MNEHQIKHLEIVQGVINRVANNSFLLKGWTITLVAAILVAYVSEAKPNNKFALLALFPAIVFWGLDAFYMRTERRYRKLHDAICKDINGNTSKVKCFSMETTQFDPDVKSWIQMFFARTVWPVHLVVVVIILVVAFGPQIIPNP